MEGVRGMVSGVNDDVLVYGGKLIEVFNNKGKSKAVLSSHYSQVEQIISFHHSPSKQTRLASAERGGRVVVWQSNGKKGYQQVCDFKLSSPFSSMDCNLPSSSFLWFSTKEPAFLVWDIKQGVLKSSFAHSKVKTSASKILSFKNNTVWTCQQHQIFVWLQQERKDPVCPFLPSFLFSSHILFFCCEGSFENFHCSRSHFFL